jgi:hypothetical protein
MDSCVISGKLQHIDSWESIGQPTGGIRVRKRGPSSGSVAPGSCRGRFIEETPGGYIGTLRVSMPNADVSTEAEAKGHHRHHWAFWLDRRRLEILKGQ